MSSRSVPEQIAELERLKTEKRVWQSGASILLLVTVVGCLLTLRGAVNGLTQEGPTRSQFVQDLSAKVQKDVLPPVEDMSLRAVREVNYGAEAQKLNKRTPELARASMDQLHILSKELPQKGEKILDSTFGSVLKKRDGKIKAMFPDVNETQISGMLANLSEEAQTQTGDVAAALFSPHQKALEGIVTDMTTIENSEPASLKSEQPTWDMALLLFDIASADLKGADSSKKSSNTISPASGGKK